MRLTNWTKKFGIKRHYKYGLGQYGICHTLSHEEGLVLPGEVYVGRLGREGFRDLRVRVQGFLQLHRDVAIALPIRAVPSPVRLRAVDLVLALGPHPTFLDQPSHVTDVDFRPHASRSSWREGLQVVVGIKGLRLPIDPPEAQRDIERLGVRDPGLGRRLLPQS